MSTSLQKLNYVIFFCLFFLSYNVRAQSEIWGMTQWGGDGAGVIFKTDLNGENQEVIYKFSGMEGGTRPSSYKLCRASNGKFYGTAHSGGVNNGGVIYEFDQSTNTYTKLYDFVFVGTGGSNPYCGVTQASNGKLYGLTVNGGLNNDGTIYEFDLSTKTYTKLYDFDDANGHPSADGGEMIQASNGKFYGVTTAGGAAWGVVFEFNPVGNVYKKLYTFPQSHYSRGLTELSNGKLYGVSVQGGSNWAGSVFTIDLATGAFATVYDFVNSTVKLPWCSLVLAADGKLYGTASSGGNNNKGGLFRFDPADNTCTILYSFDGTVSSSSKGLMQAANGKLYGMTTSLGNNNNGTIFEFDLTSNTYTVLYDFDGTNGRSPDGVLVQDVNGKLYSTSVYGGYNDNNGGLIFEFNLTGNKYTSVYKFGGTLNGSYPNGGLLQSYTGKVYGMTQFGGVNDRGVIFTVDAIQHTFTKLYDFESTNGTSPNGSLVQGADGKLYGMANGGANGMGVIFQLDPVTHAYTKRYEFDGSQGAYPAADGSLIRASNGKLYGITVGGGVSDKGVIFEFDPAIGGCTKRYDFNGASGEAVDGTIMQAANGKLYGTTYSGGSNDGGVIFEFDPTSYTYVKLHDFDDTSGSGPLGRLVQDFNGKLYGGTSNGGATNAGTFFEFDITTKTYTKLRDKGSNGGLIEASAGKIFGMTGSAIFEYDITANVFTDKVAFSGANGSGWLNLYNYNSLSLVNLVIAGVEESTFEHSVTLYPNPTSGKLTVDFEKEYSNVSANVYDITGRVTAKIMNASTSKLDLEIEGKAGFYIVEIHTREGNSAKFKVVKH